MNTYNDKEDLELRISDYLSDNCTIEEREHLLAFLATDKEAARIFQEMSATWAISAMPVFAQEEENNLVLVKARIATSSANPIRTQRLVPVWLKIASIVILLLGCNYAWYNYTDSLTRLYTQVDTPYEVNVAAGSRTNLVLPDGTEVVLNAGSKLRYYRTFGVRERDVVLDGEGYFKVAPNKELPFFVNTNGMQVKVVGTIFNVCAYDDDEYVTVSLLEGRVDLYTSSALSMKLFPSEQIHYDKKTGRIEKMRSKANTACDWLEGGLSFDNLSFTDIAHRLERKFQVDIQIESERLAEERFSGSFNSNQSLNNILKEINIDNQYTWDVKGNTILITDKKGGSK